MREIGQDPTRAGLVTSRSAKVARNDEQRNSDGGRCRLQREGRRQGNHLRSAGGGAGRGYAQEAWRGMGRARRHQSQDRRLRHLPPLEGICRRLHASWRRRIANCASKTRWTSTRTPSRADSSSSRSNRWPSAASPPSRPSRSWCRRCARPSARRSSSSSRTASTRWSAASSSAWTATACSSTSAAMPKASFRAVT